MYFYQSKETLQLTLAATLTKFERVMQLAAIARKYNLNLANNADYGKAMFEMILEVSRHQKFKLSFLQRSVCTIRQNSRLSGHVRTISENDLEYLADQIRNEPLFAEIYIRIPEEIKKHALDVLPEYLKEMIIFGQKSAEIPDEKSRIEPRRADGKERKLLSNQKVDKAVSRYSELKRELVSTEIYKKGDVIDGKYEVRGILGKGGFGVVFLVYDRDTRDVCALKTFRDELLADPTAREAFQKEALLWVNLETHPFILTAQWVAAVSGRLFVSMEYIAPDTQGRVSLADHLSQAKEPLATDQALKWAIQFCLGMEHARAHGIECHRDIKPANILITQDGALKISDFGLSAASEVAWRGSSSLGGSLVTGDEENGFGFSLMQTGGKVRCGTPGYIAPEVYRYEGADVRSDIYSFGLVLWQMAAGSRVPPFMAPWRGDMENYLRKIYEHQMAGRIPLMEGPLEEVIERCLSPEPSERYGGFQELRGVLEPIWRGRTGRTFEMPQIGNPTMDFWNKKGCALQTLGRDEEAIACYDKALAIDPRCAPVLGNKGAALQTLGRHEEAIDCFDKALAIDPRSGNSWTNKGNVLHTLGRHEEAITCFDKALAIDPLSACEWYNKGNALRQLGRHEEAIICYDKLLAIDPRDANTWNNKGNALKDINRNEEAIRCYDKTLTIDPLQTGAWIHKGNALQALCRHEEAIKCYDKALTIDPRSSLAWFNKGVSLKALGRHEEMNGCYDKALAINPRYVDAWLNKGADFHALSRHEEAIGCFDKALAIDPRKEYAWFNKALSEDALKRRHEAANSFQKFVELALPNDAKLIAYARQRLLELKSIGN